MGNYISYLEKSPLEYEFILELSLKEMAFLWHIECMIRCMHTANQGLANPFMCQRHFLFVKT